MYNKSFFVFNALFFFAYTILAACSPRISSPNILPVKDPDLERNGKDIIAIIYEIASEKKMRVISDLNMHGGAVYGQYTVQYVAEQQRSYIKKFYERYGKFKSFYGWYLNNELNPLKTDEIIQSTFWRTIWKNAVTECKKVAPQSVVTISPFFLLDKNGYRGFEYLQPVEYEQWWAKTLQETGIDILMLQDSGAEHLAFYTLNDRRPFFQAFKNACNQAGSKLWLNVETGEVDAKDWEEALKMEKTNTQIWRYTPTTWLAEKLQLASEFGEEIISWGYYPYMNPVTKSGPYISENIDNDILKTNYDSYQEYFRVIAPLSIPKGSKTKPLINGSLWWIPLNFEGWSEEILRKVVKDELDKQEAVGFDVVWIVNAPALMEYAIQQEKK